MQPQDIYTYPEAIVLGVIQGVSEFLPISSDGHLTLAGLLFGMKGPKLFFNVMLHIGTLLAVLWFYRTDLIELLQGLWRSLGTWSRKEKTLRQLWADDVHVRLAALVVLATIPTGLIGLALRKWIDEISTPLITGVFLMLSGLLLFAARKFENNTRNTSSLQHRDALTIGIAQGLAVLPGLSRSGSTIATGLFLGLEREAAARYSFLLSIPAVFAAILLELKDAPPMGNWGPVTVGALLSFVVGIFSLRLLLWVMRGRGVYTFAYYLIPLGAISAVIGLTHG